MRASTSPGQDRPSPDETGTREAAGETDAGQGAPLFPTSAPNGGSPPRQAQADTVPGRTGTRAAHTRHADIDTDTDTDTDDVIRVTGLGKRYPGGVTAVEDLDLAVHSGEIFGLLGPNGAGKTTTVGMLTTRVVPTAGTAIVGGIDVVANPARARQVIGVVSQANTLDRDLSVHDNLYFHGRYFGIRARDARAAADQWLDAFRLTAKANVRVGALSGGMTRRLMLARAMLHGPSVLFLDEPTAALDPQSRLALWEIVEALHATGQTVFLTTHYMEEAEQFCDRVAIMDHGQILALDTPDALKRQFRTSATVTVRAEGDLDRLAARLQLMRGARAATRFGDSVRLYVDQTDGVLGRLIDAAERAGYRLTDVSVTEGTLESVFIGLTGRELRE